MTPSELLEMAQLVMDEAPRTVGADRTVAAALLIRQALEAAVDGWWEQHLPAMTLTRDRAQQISLRFYADPEVANDLVWAWSRLSSICHHHAYELPPTHSEIDHILRAVERFAADGRLAAERTPT